MSRTQVLLFLAVRDLERRNIEMVVTEIQSVNSTNVIVAVFYRPPESSDSFFDEFETFLQSVESTEGNKKLLILGDFNLPKADLPNLSTCSLTGREFNYCEILKEFYLFQMVLSPTRIKGETQSILDLVITNQPDNVLNLHIVNSLDMQFSSDYSIILFDYICKLKRSPKQSRFVYRYKKANFDALRDKMNATPFLCGLDNDTIGDDWQCWQDLFTACVEQHVPKTKIRDINSPPWVDSEVIHLLHKKDAARKRAFSHNHSSIVRTSQNPAWEKYRNLHR